MKRRSASTPSTTAGSSRRRPSLGSIEVGKFGDVVVLSDDYFNPLQVPDELIRKLHPVLTIVDGKVVYNLLGQ